jgi:hypothetical protein
MVAITIRVVKTRDMEKVIKEKEKTMILSKRFFGFL